MSNIAYGECASCGETLEPKLGDALPIEDSFGIHHRRCWGKPIRTSNGSHPVHRDFREKYELALAGLRRVTEADTRGKMRAAALATLDALGRRNG